MATSCRLDGPGFETRLRKEVVLFSRTVHTEYSYFVGTWVLSQGKDGRVVEFDSLSTSSDWAKNEWC
jgi:hypothetical protein